MARRGAYWRLYEAQARTAEAQDDGVDAQVDADAPAAPPLAPAPRPHGAAEAMENTP
jgi:hypothetical protein